MLVCDALKRSVAADWTKKKYYWINVNTKKYYWKYFWINVSKINARVIKEAKLYFDAAMSSAV